MILSRRRLPPLTIRARLTLIYGGLFLASGVVLIGLTYLLVQSALAQFLEQPVMVTSQTYPDSSAEPEATGAEVDASPSAPDGTHDPAQEPRADLDSEPAPDTVVSQRFRQAQEDTHDRILDRLLVQSVVALGIATVVAVGFGWLVARRALAPLHEITATARRVAASDHNLRERIALDGPQDEIKDLADTFDEMLERLDRSFDGQRHFVSNASHELRTPLAINRTLIEVALGQPELPPETRVLCENLLTVNARNERLLDGLLTLAQSENALTDPVRLDLAEVAGVAVEQFTAEAEQAGVSLRLDLAEAPVMGDPVLLEQAAQNLVQNAIRYNQRDGWVTVKTHIRTDGEADAAGGATARRAELVVANTGPVVASYETERIFEPFQRLGKERTRSSRGVGLGLSIVRSVARVHGGTVRAIPREEGGLIITVSLPLAADPAAKSVASSKAAAASPRSGRSWEVRA
mgnify:CR=1 FL=1